MPQNLKNKNLILVLILIALIFTLFLIYNIPDNVVEYNAYITVGENIGINLTATDIQFGTVMAGGKAMKKVNITNPSSDVYKVNIKFYGDIARYLSVSENNFAIESRKNKTLIFTATTPEHIKLGEYNGKVKIIFIRSLLNFFK